MNDPFDNVEGVTVAGADEDIRRRLARQMDFIRKEGRLGIDYEAYALPDDRQDGVRLTDAGGLGGCTLASVDLRSLGIESRIMEIEVEATPCGVIAGFVAVAKQDGIGVGFGMDEEEGGPVRLEIRDPSAFGVLASRIGERVAAEERDEGR